MSLNAGTVFAYADLDMAGFSAGIGRMHREGERGALAVTQSLDRMGDSMMRVGGKLNRWVTLPLMGLGATIFKVGSDFETNMSKIEGLVGVSRDQLNAWRGDIERIGSETAKSMGELSDALFFVTSAGMRGAEAMSVLEMAAKGSAAGLGETKTVADLLTSAINAYGIENLSAAKATDILVASVREGKAEAPELAQSMGMVLPVAAELGVTFDQVGASIAAMTRTGTNASTASMQLRQILASLLRPSSDASNALEEMGTSAQDLRRQLREEGLVSVLGFLRDQMEENEDAMSRVFPNIRALSGALDIMGANADSNRQIFQNMTRATGSLDHAFQAAERTARKELNRTMAEMSQTATMFYDHIVKLVIPALQKFSEGLKNVRDWFTALDDEAQKRIIGMALLFGAAGPLLTAVAIAAKVFAGFAALMMSKFAILAGAFAIGVGAGKWFSDNMEAITSIVSREWDKTVNDIIYNIELLAKAMNFFIRQFDPTRMGIDPLIRSLGGMKREIHDVDVGFTGFMESMRSGLGDIARFVGGITGATDAYSKFLDLFNMERVDPASYFEKISQVMTRFMEPINSVGDGLTNLASNAKVAFVDIGDAAGTMERQVTESLSNIEMFLIRFMAGIRDMDAQMRATATAVMMAYHGMEDAGITSLKKLAQVTLDTARQVISAEIAKGVAAAVSSALRNVPFPFNIAAAAGAGAAAAGLFNTIVPSTSVNDAMITNSGKVIKFHPNDNILAMKDFSKLGGGGDVTVNNRLFIDGREVAISMERVSIGRAR
jgi:TP901 family phage tail tape measure protein